MPTAKVNPTGIFGPRPAEVAGARRDRANEEGYRRAQLPRGRGAVVNAAKAGGAFGDVAGAAMGMVDPAEERAKLLQEARQEVELSGADMMKDPEGFFSAVYDALDSRGLTDEAMAVAEQYRQMDLERRTMLVKEQEAEAKAVTAASGAIDATTNRDKENRLKTELKSTPGQILRDREKIIAEYGENSEQLKQFEADSRKSLEKNRFAFSIEEEEAFRKNKGGNIADAMEQYQANADLAVGIEPDLRAMRKLLSTAQVATGSLQPMFTGIQGIASDLGVNIQEAADKAGLGDIGNLASKEEFNRLARAVMIQGFRFFKGNLNREEVRIAEDAYAQLGKSEEANRRAIRHMLAAQRLAIRRGRLAALANSAEDGAKVRAQIFSDYREDFDIAYNYTYAEEIVQHVKNGTLSLEGLEAMNLSEEVNEMLGAIANGFTLDEVYGAR